MNLEDLQKENARLKDELRLLQFAKTRAEGNKQTGEIEGSKRVSPYLLT